MNRAVYEKFIALFCFSFVYSGVFVCFSFFLFQFSNARTRIFILGGWLGYCFYVLSFLSFLKISSVLIAILGGNSYILFHLHFACANWEFCWIVKVVTGKVVWENNIYGLLAGSSVSLVSYSGLEKHETHPPVKDDPVSKQPQPVPQIQEKAGRSVLKYLTLSHWRVSCLIVF